MTNYEKAFNTLSKILSHAGIRSSTETLKINGKEIKASLTKKE